VYPLGWLQGLISPLSDPRFLSRSQGEGRGWLAGINGGYFFRLDVSTFKDNVCRGKSRDEALQPPSLASPNAGVGDALLIRDGKLLASNCDCRGFRWGVWHQA
jgi:hypothetical protein